jgi:hypothetical protein
MKEIGPTQDKDQWRALLNAVMKLWVPQNDGKYLSGYTTGGLSRRGSDPSSYLVTVKLYVTKKVQTPWPLVRKRTIPTDQPPLVGEI